MDTCVCWICEVYGLCLGLGSQEALEMLQCLLWKQLLSPPDLYNFSNGSLQKEIVIAMASLLPICNSLLARRITLKF